MYLFVCENYRDQGTTEELVCRAAETFLKERNIDTGSVSMIIQRTEKGKPYFTELPVQFSVSHTGNLWVCLMREGTDPVGVDIQTVRDYSYDKIASRYYTEDEQKEVEKQGKDAFFKIWTCKEAYAKYTGKGLGSYLKEVSSTDNEEVAFIELDIKSGIKGTCCVREKEELWITKV